MKFPATVLRVIGSTLVIAAVLLSCTKSNKTAAGDNQAAAAGVETISELTDALVIFLTGEVDAIDASGERPLDIGDTLAAGEQVRTGPDGYAELQIGSLGTVRVNSDTEYRLEAVELSDGKAQSSGALVAGSIIAKVRKLSGNDAFEVNVPGAICAVRGTQFFVSADLKGSIRVAVDEGSVHVIPPSLAVVGNDARSMADILELRSIMPLVGPSEELVFDKGMFEELEAKLASWAEEEMAVHELIEKATPVLETLPIVITEISEENTTAMSEASLSLDGSFSEESSNEPVILTVRTDSDDTRILINGRKAGRHSASQIFRSGETVEIQAITADGRTKTETVEAGTQSVVHIVFDEIAEKPVVQRTAVPESDLLSVTIDVEPKNASIWIDGKNSGQGSTVISGHAGERRKVSASAPGYAMMEAKEVTIRPGEARISFELALHTIVSREKLSGQSVGTPAANGNYGVVAGRDGVLTVMNRDGVITKRLVTGDKNVKSMLPTIIGNNVYSIGNAAFTVFDLRTGVQVQKRGLSEGMKNQFGRRVVQAGKLTILPGDKNLELIESTGKTLGMIEIPGGSHSSPAAWNDKILIANQQGSLVLIDAQSRAVESSVQTGALRPTGQIPIVIDDTAIIAGLKGTVSAVNLGEKSIAWERPLIQGTEVTVNTEIAAARDTVYVYGSNRVFALAVQNGKERFQPLKGITAPPMVAGRFLYLCREDSQLAIHDRMSGAELGTIPLEENAKARPAQLGDYVLVGGNTTVFVLDVRSITER